MRNNLQALILGLVGLGASMSVWNVEAADLKIYAPQGVCAPYTPTTSMSELIIRPYGITNGGSTPEAVMCSIPVDSETVWTATDGKTAQVDVTFQGGSVGGDVTCQVYVGSSMDSPAALFSGSKTLNPNDVDNVTISGIHSDAVIAGGGFMANFPASLYCRIPPKSTMLRIRVTENGAQDTDDAAM